MKSTAFRAFTGFFQHFADMLQITDILKMCMKKFDAEKIVFAKLTEFLTETFFDDCTCTLWNQLLLQLSLDLFKTVQIS